MPRPIPVEEMVKQFKGHHQNSHIIKIDNFSLFKKHQINNIESLVFDIGGHKWKLDIYPNDSNGRISLYLAIQNSGSMPSNWQFKLHFQLFILNQFQQNWKCEEVENVFNASHTIWGQEVMSVDEFNDPEKGYLVEDCALLGVKFLGMIIDPKGGTAESFALTDNFPSNKFAWKIAKFSTLDQLSYDSEEFITGKRKWRMQVYPRGSGEIQDMLEVYLKAEGFTDNTPKAPTYVRYTLRLLDQINENHITVTYLNLFPADPFAYGASKLMPLKDLQTPWNCYLVNDTLYVEAEVHVISHSKSL